MKQLEFLHHKISSLESKFQINDAPDYAEYLNFNLVPVVYDWALQKVNKLILCFSCIKSLLFVAIC